MSHASPRAQIPSTNHRHHLRPLTLSPFLSVSRLLFRSRTPVATLRHLSPGILAPARASQDEHLNAYILPALSLRIHCLLLTLYLPVSFALIRWRMPNTSLFLRPDRAASLRLARRLAVPLRFFFFFFFFLPFYTFWLTLCPLLPHSSCLQLSPLCSLSSHTSSPPFSSPPIPFFFTLLLPTPPLPLLLSHPLSLAGSPMNISPPVILHPRLALLVLSPASRRCIPLTCLVRSLDFPTSRDMYVYSCSTVLARGCK